MMAQQVAMLEQVIHNLFFAMRHASPEATNTLRKYRDEFDEFYLSIMDSHVVSNVDLRYYLQRSELCIQDCIGAASSNKAFLIPKPTPPIPYTLPDVTKVNIIFYIDSTESIKENLVDNGQISEVVHSLIRQIFWEMEKYRESGQGLIECISSLVWFGDATDGADKFNSYNIAHNKVNISLIPQSLSVPVLISGGNSLSESGLHAINATFTTLIQDGYATRVVYISDSPAKSNEAKSIASIIKSLFIKNNTSSFGLFPTETQPNIKDLFTHCSTTQSLTYNLDNWASKMFRN
jgi:hypothetical protein